MIDKGTGLPKAIEIEGITYTLDYQYFGGLDNFWVLNYTSFRSFPNKKVALHRHESTLERCIAGAKRDLKRIGRYELV